MNKNFKIALTTTLALAAVTGCKPTSTEEASIVNKKLYVASGTCYSGTGITTYTGSQTGQAISSYDTVTGSFQGDLFKMSDITPYDENTTPVKIVNSAGNLLLLTENATSQGDRRVIKIPKSSPLTYTPYASDYDAFTNVAATIVRDFALSPDGAVVFSKSTLVEKVSPANIRVVKAGANPWVNPIAATGTCFPAVPTLINKVTLMNPFTAGDDGKMIMTHTGATVTLNRIFAVSRTGLTSAAAADCSGATAGGLSTVPHANTTAPGVTGVVAFNAAGANPVDIVYIPTPAPALTAGKLVVAYSTPIITLFDNNTSFNTGIVVWDVNEASDTAVTFTAPTILYRNTSVVWAPSALAYDASTSSLYVAVGGRPGLINQTTNGTTYNIEKFTLNLDPTAPSLTRVHTDNKPFFKGNNSTKCISSMVVE